MFTCAAKKFMIHVRNIAEKIGKSKPGQNQKQPPQKTAVSEGLQSPGATQCLKMLLDKPSYSFLYLAPLFTPILSTNFKSTKRYNACFTVAIGIEPRRSRLTSETLIVSVWKS